MLEHLVTMLAAVLSNRHRLVLVRSRSRGLRLPRLWLASRTLSRILKRIFDQLIRLLFFLLADLDVQDTLCIIRVALLVLLFFRLLGRA
jgi:hypothetical protein